jgi:methylmalonyl-CoA/ethylmalonyl-CoA epimerase
MKPTHIEHIGVAVKNLEKSVGLFERLLGVRCYAIEEVKDQQVRTAFFKVGQTKIELLESTSPEGPIGKFIGQNGEGVHHIAFAVEDVEASLKGLDAAGVRVIDEKPRKGAEGLRIAFLHPISTNGVLVELCERGEV